VKTISIAVMAFLGGCVGIPDNVKPIGDFKLDRYLGKWYEIARLEQSFEKGLSHVTAEYSVRDDGGVKVVNRGYSVEDSSWKEAEGKAYFVDSVDQGYLKVSFFGPFYGSYIVLDLDRENYQYSLVCGPKKSYLWLLSRTPEMDAALRDSVIAKAAALGFEVDKLIYVDQRGSPVIRQ
jgi:apolipoprotein D and lipocalin family protein